MNAFILGVYLLVLGVLYQRFSNRSRASYNGRGNGFDDLLTEFTALVVILFLSVISGKILRFF